MKLKAVGSFAHFEHNLVMRIFIFVMLLALSGCKSEVETEAQNEDLVFENAEELSTVTSASKEQFKAAKKGLDAAQKRHQAQTEALAN